MRRSDLVWLAGLALGYVGSREALRVLGVQFDSVAVQEIWQALPVELLQQAPGASLWALHSQPPLYNALLAAVLATADWPDAALRAVFAMAAASTLLLLFLLMRAWHTPPWLAGVATAAVGLNPSFIGYEHWPFYAILEPPFLVMTTLSATAWAGPDKRAATWARAAFAASAGGAVLLRALFHPAWAAAIAVPVLLVRRRAGRLSAQDVAAAAAPVACGVALMVKTAIVAGTFATSSWTGLNVAHTAFAAVSDREAAALESAGRISPLHRVGMFAPIEQYRPFASIIESALPRPVPTGVAALDLERKASGQPNFNHLWYAGISRLLLRDALTVVRVAPARVATVVGRALALFCRPTSEYGGIARTVQTVGVLEAWYRQVLYPGNSIAVVVLAIAATTLFAGWSAWPGRTDGQSLDPAGAGVLLTTVVWVVVVANVAEYGENNRFRFAIDPLMVAALTAGSSGMIRAWLAGGGRKQNGR